MPWYGNFATQTDAVLGQADNFVNDNRGMLLCVAVFMVFTYEQAWAGWLVLAWRIRGARPQARVKGASEPGG
jgi:hypothetical protein